MAARAGGCSATGRLWAAHCANKWMDYVIRASSLAHFERACASSSLAAAVLATRTMIRPPRRPDSRASYINNKPKQSGATTTGTRAVFLLASQPVGPTRQPARAIHSSFKLLVTQLRERARARTTSSGAPFLCSNVGPCFMCFYLFVWTIVAAAQADKQARELSSWRAQEQEIKTRRWWWWLLFSLHSE